MIELLVGHVLDRLAELPAESVHCVVTSPPYYGLRDYGIEPQVWGDGWRGSLGLEPTLNLYLDHMVEVFGAVRRVMRSDATCWLNIGDSYAGATRGSGGHNPKQDRNKGSWMADRKATICAGLKPKDLMMIPARLAIRLQDDGWWVRADIAWCKRAPMPESCTDRPTTAWEHVFLLTKSAKYFYDADAVKEDADGDTHSRGSKLDPPRERAGIGHIGFAAATQGRVSKRNMRNFWLLGPEPFPEAHFATFPTEIPRRAILAGSKPGDTILDPFLGAGTTALVADQLQRDCIGIELSPKYAEMTKGRIYADSSLFAEIC